MDPADLIEAALHAKGIATRRADEEPAVVMVEGVGSLWGDVGKDGKMCLWSLSRKYKDDWGSTHQRNLVVDDPTDAQAITDAVHELYESIR